MARSQKSRPQDLLGNHQNSWLWGTVPVFETLSNRGWPVHELLLSEAAAQPIHEQCQKLARSRNIPIRREPTSRFEQLCKSRDHQGIAALLGPYPYARFADLLKLLKSSKQAGRGNLFVMLDRLQDPFNMGAIVRSAAAFGCQGLIIGERSQVGVNSHVTRSSAGGVNHIPICQQADLTDVVKQFQQAGAKVLAATMQGDLPVEQVRETTPYSACPLLLIIGNEATGVSDELLERCDSTVSIPMNGQVESLNAAVAAGILLFSLSR